MKDYQHTLDWMFKQLPMYQKVGATAFKKDLTNILKLTQELGEPQKRFKTLHVAGTNGKGSTSHMLASVLQEAGFKTGLYTSPHLRDFRERIKINGEMIPQKQVVDFVENNKAFLKNNELSFFEMTVGMAFHYFAQEKVAIAIIEVGMGGRLDSTNIITPELSVITNIGLDHTQFLGSTLAEIAREKAGIIKKGIPVIISEKQKETKVVFEEVAKKNESALIFAQEMKLPQYTTDLKGNYQQKNIKAVLAALQVLKDNNWQISKNAIFNGLNNVKLNTGLQGRWEILQEKPKTICDTAHNREGLQEVFQQLNKEEFAQLHIVLGMVKDKDFGAILPIFPKNASYYFCQPNVPRGLPVSKLREKALKAGLNGNEYPSVKDAKEAALNSALDQDLVFIGGSTFTVAEII